LLVMIRRSLRVRKAQTMSFVQNVI
jgi:hypothetical protein